MRLLYLHGSTLERRHGNAQALLDTRELYERRRYLRAYFGA